MTSGGRAEGRACGHGVESHAYPPHIRITRCWPSRHTQRAHHGTGESILPVEGTVFFIGISKSKFFYHVSTSESSLIF